MPSVKLVVCGSAASWMVRRIVLAKGGLHNRVTRRIGLSPAIARAPRRGAQVELSFDRRDGVINLVR
jgi:hypothetical protein